MTHQHRHHSFLEACINTGLGFGSALATQLLIFPLFSIHIPLSSNPSLSAIFTVVSIARGYFVRRLFVYLHMNEIL